MKFEVRAEHWQEANRFFADNPHLTTCYLLSDCIYYFIKTNTGEVFAIPHINYKEYILGAGTYGSVVYCQNEAGTYFACKVMPDENFLSESDSGNTSRDLRVSTSSSNAIDDLHAFHPIIHSFKASPLKENEDALSEDALSTAQVKMRS